MIPITIIRENTDFGVNTFGYDLACRFKIANIPSSRKFSFNFISTSLEVVRSQFVNDVNKEKYTFNVICIGDNCALDCEGSFSEELEDLVDGLMGAISSNTEYLD